MMKITKFLTLMFVLLTFTSFAQKDYWEDWNKNYPEINVVDMLQHEKVYADSIEKNPKIPQNYGRAEKYRFQVEYVGNVRPLDKSIEKSMRYVFKMFVGNPSQLDNMFDSEVLFKIGDENIWMPVQKKLMKPLKKENKKGGKLTLYCFYLNDHTKANGLRNIFLVSEFNK